MNRHFPTPTALAAAIFLAAPGTLMAQAPEEPPSAERIFVTATASPAQVETIGSALTVIDGAAIERSRAAYLHDLLRGLPGLAVVQTGSFGSPAQVRIRGAEGNHTLVLVNGIEVSSIGQSEFDFGTLLAASIDRVEVLRGPQSGLYGSNALGGVINVITRGGEGPLLDAAIEAGSYETIMARGAMTLGDRERFLAASGVLRSTGGFSSARAGDEPDGDRNLTAYLRGGTPIGPALRLDGSLRLVDRHGEADAFDFSGGPQQGLPIDDDSFSDTQELSGGLALRIAPTEAVSALLSAAYNRFEMAGGNGDVGAYGNTGDRLKVGGRLSLSFTTGGLRHALTAFTDYEREEYRNTFPTSPDQAAEQAREILGLGAEYRLDLFDTLFLKAALRHDENSRFQDATTYGLTASWVIGGGGTRLHASYGKGVTNPTFTEQFGFFPGQFIGNPDLLPEHATGFDIGLEQRLGTAVLLDVTYFSSTLEDEIVDRFPTVVNDVGRSEREGVELAARLDLGAIDLGAAYTYLAASDPDGTPEVQRPEHQASLDAAAAFGPQRRGTVSLGAFYNGGMVDNDFRNYFTNGFVAEKTRLAGHLVARLAGSYRIGQRLELFGRVENLFDEEYEEVIGYGTPGLSAYGGLRVTIP